MARPHTDHPPEPSARERLLAAATRVFSRLGFETATTRAIADEAGVNLASIPYYFGTKEALYLAVIEGICASITLRMAGPMASVQRLLDTPGADPAAFREALCGLVEQQVDIVLGADMEAAAPILAREQASPSPAFEKVYHQVLEPSLDLAAALVGRLSGLAPEAPEVRLRAYALLGMGVHLAYARQSFRRYVGHALPGAEGQTLVRQTIRDLVAAALAQAGTAPTRSLFHTQEC